MERDKQAEYERAVGIMVTHQRVSTSYIQRKLATGYNKAAELVLRAEREGVISASSHIGKREVLIPFDTTKSEREE